MFAGEDCFAMKHVNLADRFFLFELFGDEAQCFRAIERASVRRDRLVESKHALRFGGCLFRVLQTALVIAGLDVMMGQLLDRAGNLSRCRSIPSAT